MAKIYDDLERSYRTVLEEYDYPELMDSLDWSVQEGIALDGASKDEVRDRFRDWVSSSAAAEEMLPGYPSTSTSMLDTPRYNFCIHVDADSLDSVVDRGPPPEVPDMNKISYVNLLDVNFKMPDLATFDWESEGMVKGVDDPTDDGEPPVEGRTLEDVGWMKLCVDGLAPEAYAELEPVHRWYEFYRRPPIVAYADQGTDNW